jgi:hypothetical protein
MMIRQLPLDTIDDVLFVPRAIVATPVWHFAKRLDMKLVDGYDDLDYFEGLVLSLSGEVPFTLTRHRGNDPDQTTVSLPADIGTVRAFAAILDRIVNELDIASGTIVWRQDRDDPPRRYA